jgi:hypothetical protein
MGFFDDIFIPEDAMQHPSKLYPFVYALITFCIWLLSDFETDESTQ